MSERPLNHPTLIDRIVESVGPLDFSARTLRDYGFVLVGAFLQAVAMRLFLIPSQLVSGGISGAAQIINYYTHWPVGLMTFVGNAPLFIIGWRYLGGARFALRTALGVFAFSFLTDFLVLFLPLRGLTDDIVLNTVYGGLLLGIGLGIVYRGKGTSGGSDILARVMNERLHLSISQSYLITDAAVVLAGGFAFGWKVALYGLVVIYISGLAAEMASEGENIFRTALIVTNQPIQVSQAIMSVLERGVTILPGTGAFTGSDRPVLYCVVTRAEVSLLKTLVRESDPKAFMVIGAVHEALGEGFRPLVR
jgi:uncharacterized membrane-anchored protein YitT (DUF2179 family)